jgi:hypothetical protein
MALELHRQGNGPDDGRANSDVAKFYSGQRVITPTGSGLVESVITYTVGQSFNQNLVVNELRLKFDSVNGSFEPGQTVVNIDSTEQVTRRFCRRLPALSW